MCYRVVRLFLNCIEVRWALVTLTHSSQLKKTLAYVSEVPRLCWRIDNMFLVLVEKKSGSLVTPQP